MSKVFNIIGLLIFIGSYFVTSIIKITFPEYMLLSMVVFGPFAYPLGFAVMTSIVFLITRSILNYRAYLYALGALGIVNLIWLFYKYDGDITLVLIPIVVTIVFYPLSILLATRIKEAATIEKRLSISILFSIALCFVSFLHIGSL